MALINRVSRLFTADLHAVLDRIEEPDVLLNQAIREMEEDLAKSEQRLSWLEHESENLASRRKELERLLAEIDDQLGICFDSGEEELARSLIRRKLESERLLKQLAAKIDANKKERDSQQAALDDNRRRLEHMRQKAEVLGEQRADESQGVDGWLSRGLTVGDDEVEVAFLREKQRRAKS